MADLITQGDYGVYEVKTPHLKPKSILKLKPIIDGYFIHRPTHVEINVKSPYLASLMKNDKELVYTDFGMVYDVDFDSNLSLYSCMNKNNSVFLTSTKEPNVTFLRSPKIADGFKTKIRGIIFPEDLITYEHKFNTVVNNLVTFLTRPKPKSTYQSSGRLQTLKSIRAGKIYDGNGWVHHKDCTCVFNHLYHAVSLCERCDMYNVKLTKNYDEKPLGVCS